MASCALHVKTRTSINYLVGFVMDKKEKKELLLGSASQQEEEKAKPRSVSPHSPGFFPLTDRHPAEISHPSAYPDLAPAFSSHHQSIINSK